MKPALTLALSVALVALAADAQDAPVQTAPTQPQIQSQPQDPPASEPAHAIRLRSVRWDVDTHKLSWTVQIGTFENGEFTPASERVFEVLPSESLMTTDGEQRGIEVGEAAAIDRLLHILSVYCVQSVFWWAQGDGTGVQPDAAPTAPQKPAAPKAQPSEEPDPKPVRVAAPLFQPARQPIPDLAIPVDIVTRGKGYAKCVSYCF